MDDTGDAAARRELPLLEEVASLLEKERALLGLKILEQQVEAQDWKKKYEELIEKVADVAAKTDPKVYEIAAEVHSKHVKAPSYRAKVMEALRAEGVNWVVDLSDTTVGVEGLTEVLKILNGMRDSCKITTMILRNSELDSSCTEQLAAVVSFPYLEAIDMSSNELSRSFYDMLLKALEVRRRPPQYLILNNNPDMGGISFSKMLQVLSQETWGIVVTVRDSKSTTDHGHKAKPTMLAAEFLKVLNTQLVGNNKMQKGRNQEKTASSAVGKQKLGIQLLSALGLVNSALSRVSMKLLEETLSLSIATLTDLDLSFSLIGYRGMEMLKECMILKSKSQIVRLGLKGNAFSNAVVPLLGSIVQNSITLTYLDISHNMISGEGLVDLGVLMQRNFILSTLCITGNPIGQNSATHVQDMLSKCGCPVQIRWNGILCSVPAVKEPAMRRGKNKFIYSFLRRKATMVPSSGDEAVVYSIPVGCIQIKQSIQYPAQASTSRRLSGTQIKDKAPSVAIKKMLVEWNMRPRYEDATIHADMDRINHRRVVTDIFLPMEWDIYLVTPQGRSSLATQRLRAGAGLPPPDTWIKCRAVVDAPPAHGHIEVVLRAIQGRQLDENYDNPKYLKATSDILSKTTAFRTSKPHVFPAIQVDSFGLNFSVYDDASSEDTVFGQDLQQWSGTLNQVVSLRTSALTTMPTFNPLYEISDSISTIHAAGGIIRDFSRFLPPGHTVMRLLLWPGPVAPVLSVVFQTKLSTRNKISTEGIEATWGLGENEASNVSYECSVHICYSHGEFASVGTCSVLPNGKCIGSDNVAICSNTPTGPDNLLSTWLWREWKVTCPMIRPGDRIFITGVARSPLASAISGAASSSCFIHCRGARIVAPFDTFEAREELVDIDQSVLFSVHNDPTLLPCL